ncbi:MAG: FAD-dependent oxidoreductase [Chloroflexaceae bacterium]|nr:FAD-dependent oxidoreductase [Chloroflexaceae bacterium]
MTSHVGTEARPLRVAIIGAGPAGFYTAEALLKQKNLVCSIDLINRLPTPFGLVRDGVAPDHQSIKAVTRVYEKIAANPNVRYYGNVTFGQDIMLSDLIPHYDQIVYAVGAQSDRKMGIPGEDLAGSFPATIFVGWYNGHPDYRDLEFDLSHERAIVVGNGNVAMDVTRILVSSPDDLAKTDIADHALEHLRQSKVREVVVLGRRGPAQAAFTNPEIKEFGELTGVDPIVDPAELDLDEVSIASLADNKMAARNVETMRSYTERISTPGNRRICMRFLVSPVELIGANGRVAAVKIEKNALYPSDDGSLRSRGTGVFEIIEAGLVLRSVGYQGVPLKDVPFDTRKYIVSNQSGRVTDPESGKVVAGQYTVGWIKRGPSGVIGTNKADAVDTVKAMIEDLPQLSGIDDANRDPALIQRLIAERKPDHVSYQDWQLLDTYEIKTGEPQGRPRVKVTRVPDMLQVIRQNKAM